MVSVVVVTMDNQEIQESLVVVEAAVEAVEVEVEVIMEILMMVPMHRI